LDRLSRAEPIQAQAQLTQTINAGITVVTASDGLEYIQPGRVYLVQRHPLGMLQVDD
jgi:hypothetical protein